ncbi:MAG: AAA family ATPase [Polyangiales bacterium]
MITTVEIKDPKKTPIKWLPSVKALAEPRVFEFKPGLNILWGRNGSGKSTLLQLLARYFHCHASGFPVVTHDSLKELFDDGGMEQSFSSRNARVSEADRLRDGFVVKHDGQGVCFFDPSNAPGLIGGGAASDDDFFGEGVRNTMFKGSAGQTLTFRFDRIATSLLLREDVPVESRVRKDHVNDFYSPKLASVDGLLAGSIDKGQPTVLFDEPERSLDLPAQVNTWRMTRAFSKEVQFIVASHSLYALNLPDAHYIEMEPGYLEKSLLARAKLDTFAAEDPQPPSRETIAKMVEFNKSVAAAKAEAKAAAKAK